MIEKICKNCGWAVYRASRSGDDEMIDDKGISKEYLCRKMNLKVYSKDRACPQFILTDEFFHFSD